MGKPVPPIAHCFVDDRHASLVQKIFDIPEREWEANVDHYRQSDDLGAAVRALERVRVGHAQKPRGRPARPNRHPSGMTHVHHNRESDNLRSWS